MRLEDLDGLSRDQQFKVAADNAGVPVEILQRMWQKESGSGTNMGPSTAGAEGHFQQMPKTRRSLEQREGRTFDPYDFQQGLYMASTLMKENMQHFGTVPKALAAYNGGWDETKWDNSETKDYVSTILAGGQGSVMDLRPGELRDEMYSQQLDRAQKTAANKPDKLTETQKGAFAVAAAESLLAGSDIPTTADYYQSLKANPEAVVAAATPTPQQPVQPDYTAATSIIQQQVDASVKEQEAKDNQSYSETFQAAFQQNSVAAMIMREVSMATARDTDEARVVDQEWMKHYQENRKSITAGMSPAGQMEADGARNQHEFDIIKADDIQEQKNSVIMTRTDHPLLWGITATMLDPVALGAGVVTDGLFTAGRAASLAAAGARVTAGASAATLPAVEAGTNLIARGAVTGAATNLEVTAMMQALGKETSIHDYMHAAAAGLALGVLGGAVGHGLTKLDIQELLGLVNRTHEKAATDAIGDIEAARAAAGAAFSPELAKQAKQQAIQRVQDDLNGMHQPVAPESKPFGQHSEPHITANANAGMKYGIDTVSDEATFNAQTGLILDGEKWANDRPRSNAAWDKEAEASNIRGKVGMESVGHILGTDKNPLARMISDVVAENASGVGALEGNRRMTVAIDSKVRWTGYMGGFEHSIYANFQDYSRSKGFGKAVTAINTFTTGDIYEQFMREVATEIRARNRPDYTPSASQAVIRAANRAEIGFQQMADDQRLNMTLGNEFIPESSVGYLPQQLNGAAFNKLSATERQRVIAALETQARKTFKWDGEFAMAKVREYIKRAEDYATSVGGMTPPSPKGLHSIAMDELREKLAAGTLTQEQYIAGVERLRTGAAKHTGKRLDWDLTEMISRDDGSLMPLSDLYVNDVVELYRSYANRTAGDVAFARVGILGDRDIDLITNTLRSAKVGNPLETVPAWQQLVAEIYNRPVSQDAHAAAGKILRPIRVFTTLRMLGGTVFPQLAETANIMTHLGVVNTLGLVRAIPRLAGEIDLIRRGEIPEDSILASIDRIVGAPLGAEEYQFVLPRVFDDATGILDGYSMSTVNRILAGGQAIHQKFSFMRYATTIQKRFAAEEIVAKALRFINSGIEENALADMGFTPELRKILKDNIQAFAQFDGRGYVNAFDARQIPVEAQADFIAAVYRGTNQIIQGTFPGETGKWMRTELTQTLMQFRKFPAVAIEKQMMRQFRNLGTARSLGGIATAMGLGSLIYIGRAQIAASLMPERERKKYLEMRLSIGGIAAGATSYVSALGMTTDVMNLFSGAAHMANDQWNLGLWNSRGIPANGLGSIVPGLGTVDDLYNLSQNPSAKAGLQLLPFSNLPMVLPLLNMAKGNLAEREKQ